MRSFSLTLAALSATALAQIPTLPTQTYADKTGTRSLFLPFITQDPVLASIVGNNTANETTYVLACPKTVSSCFFSPNLTFTEGPTACAYVTTNSAGAASINCQLNGTTSAVCEELQTGNGGGNIRKATSTFSASDVTFQAVDVTSTNNNTSTMPQTVTITALPTTSSSTTSSSTAGAQTGNTPWAMGGAAGAALAALAAL